MIRPMKRDEHDAVCTLWNRCAPHDPVSPALLEQKVWGDPDFDPEAALVHEANGALVGLGMGVVRPGEARRGYVKLLAVDPDYRRRGVGTALLAALEAHLWATGAAELRMAESTPNYLTPGIDARDTSGWLFSEARGYARFGQTYNLMAPLEGEHFDVAADAHRLAQADVDVRRATAEDQDAMVAFLDEYWAAWNAEVAQTFDNDPVSLHIALKAGKIIGFSAYDTNNRGLPWFGPMGTAPAARGLGVGGALLRRCLKDQQAQGHTESIIPWVGPIRFYSNQVKAVVDRVFFRYRKARV